MTDLREKLAETIMGDRAVDNWGNPLPCDYDLADAIIAALPDMVVPLVWWKSDTGDLCCDTMIGRYQIQKGGVRWCCMYAMGNKRRPKGDDAPTWHRSEEAAKAAAQAHHVAASLALFGVQGEEA